MSVLLIRFIIAVLSLQFKFLKAIFEQIQKKQVIFIDIFVYDCKERLLFQFLMLQLYVVCLQN